VQHFTFTIVNAKPLVKCYDAWGDIMGLTRGGGMLLIATLAP